MLKKTAFYAIIGWLFGIVLYANAVAQIAPGVTQSAAQTAAITGTVLQSNGAPVTGADLRLDGPAVHLRTASDARGTFIFTSVPYGTYTIEAVDSRLGIATRSGIVLQGDINVAIQYAAPASGLKEIARVSTSSAGAQINITPASIASVNPADYAFEGNTSWRTLLGRIPGVAVGGSLSNGGPVTDTLADSPFLPVTLSINGALPYETLATLDGMPIIDASIRSSAGGGADLSNIPMSLFETADVVRGPGANAPSIVDSIGGSFVLHAPGSVDKNRATFSVSNDPYGAIVPNGRVELRFGRLSAMVSYGVNDSPGPLGKGSVISAYSGLLTPSTVNGLAFGGCGSVSCYSSITVPGYQTGSTVAVKDGLLVCCSPVSSVWSQHSGGIGVSYEITPSITAQMFYTGSSSSGSTPYGKYQTIFAPDPAYAGSIAPGAGSYITALPYSLAQSSSLLEEKVTASLGRGVLRLAALQDNSFESCGSSLYPASGQYTLYGVAKLAGTPTVFNGTPAALTFISYITTYSSAVHNRDMLLSYATQVGTKSNVGVSYVMSYYNNPYVSTLIFNGINFGGSSEGSAVSETTKEFRIYGGTELSDTLSVEGSWYFARGDYHVLDPAHPGVWTDSVYPYNAPRIGITWRANKDLVIRGAAGGGYALPQLSQLVGSNSIVFAGTPPAYQETLTNLSLQPETAFGFDIGADWRFHHDNVLSLDLYRTNLYGQFYNSTYLAGSYTGVSGTAPLYISSYGNLGRSRYEGINLDFRNDVRHGIFWHGALGLTRAYVMSVPAGFYDKPGAPNSVNLYIVPGINFNAKSLSAIPYATAAVDIGYRWSLQKYIELSPTYYGNNNVYSAPAFVELDAKAGYPLTRNVSLLATFRNITGILGQNILTFSPSSVMGVPSVAGGPFAAFQLPYGPRSLIVTTSFSL